MGSRRTVAGAFGCFVQGHAAIDFPGDREFQVTELVIAWNWGFVSMSRQTARFNSRMMNHDYENNENNAK
jgi:hypothetical protein